MTAPIKLGANCWNQYTDWPSWLAAAARRSGSATTPSGPGTTCTRSSGPWQGPILERYTAMAALATTTERARRSG